MNYSNKKSTIVLLSAICISLVFAAVVRQNAVADGFSFSQVTVSTDQVSGSIVADRLEDNPKLDTKLNEVVEAFRSHPENWQERVDTGGLLIEGNDILLEIKFDASEIRAVREFLDSNEMRLRHHNAPGLFEAWLPVRHLETMVGHDGIYFVRPARLVEDMVGNSTSQGVATSNADVWHSGGLDGTGQTIAIIDGFNDTTGEVAGLQASGDWPPNSQLTTVDVHGGGFGSNGTNHGLATLEIAYDMAPGADFIAYDTVTVGDWYSAIGMADAAGADIVSASLGAPLDGIGDGTALPGSIAEAAGNARANGVLVVNAAGNSRESHWGGLYNGNGTSPGGGYVDSHDWGGGGNLNLGLYCLPNGYVASVDLFWNDWTNVDHDYDLFLFQYDGSSWNQVAQSTNFQDGSAGQTPQESIDYAVSGGSGGYGCPIGTNVVAVMIAEWLAATDKNLQVFTNFGFGISVEERSLGFPADSPNVMSVAAVDVSTLAQESYSSEGPILSPGGGLPGVPGTKPNVTAYANVDTESYGASAFNGTSAATPHVAGWAALIWQDNPAFTVSQLETEIHNIASSDNGSISNDLGTTGHDSEHGYGLARFLFTPTAITGVTTTTSAELPTGLARVIVMVGILLSVASVVAIRRTRRGR